MRKIWAIFQGLSKVQKWLYTAAAILVAGGVICGAVLLASGAESPEPSTQDSSQNNSSQEQSSAGSSQTVTSVVESSAPPASSAPMVTSRPAVSSKPATSSKVTTSTVTSSQGGIPAHIQATLERLDMYNIQQDTEMTLACAKEENIGLGTYCGMVNGRKYFRLFSRYKQEYGYEKVDGVFYYTEEHGFLPIFVKTSPRTWFYCLYKGNFYFLKSISETNTLELWVVDPEGNNPKMLRSYDFGWEHWVDMQSRHAVDAQGNLYVWLQESYTNSFLVRINLETYAYEELLQVEDRFEYRMYLTNNKLYTIDLWANKGEPVIYVMNHDGSQQEILARCGMEFDDASYGLFCGDTRLPILNDQKNIDDVEWRATDEGLYYTTDGSTYYIDAATKTVTKVE